MKLRLAAVSFLNARPITYGLEHGLGEHRFDLSFDLPSRCAEALAAGDVDLALIPSATFATIQSGTLGGFPNPPATDSARQAELRPRERTARRTP